MFKPVQYRRNFLFFSFCMFNPCLTNVFILYLVKTQENQRFYVVSMGYKMKTLAKNRLKHVL